MAKIKHRNVEKDRQENGFIFNHQVVMDVMVWVGKNFLKRKTTNFNCSTYKLKHIVQRELGFYVSETELIAAALLAGFSVKYSGSTAFINAGVSKKLICPKLYNDKRRTT